MVTKFRPARLDDMPTIQRLWQAAVAEAPHELSNAEGARKHWFREIIKRGRMSMGPEGSFVPAYLYAATVERRVVGVARLRADSPRRRRGVAVCGRSCAPAARCCDGSPQPRHRASGAKPAIRPRTDEWWRCRSHARTRGIPAATLAHRTVRRVVEGRARSVRPTESGRLRLAGGAGVDGCDAR
jgi:hypothetical protein